MRAACEGCYYCYRVAMTALIMYRDFFIGSFQNSSFFRRKLIKLPHFPIDS